MAVILFCCTTRGALSHPLLLPLELFIGLDGGLGEAVVVPPAGQRGADGEACAHQLLHLGGLDGQHGLARCTQQLVGQRKAQHRRAGHGGGGDVLRGILTFLSLMLHQLLMDLHTLNKFLTIKDKHILLYEHNAFTSHLMLDSDEVYQMTKRELDAAQISAAKRIHLNLVMVKLLELHHLGYDLRHYHTQHHAFIKKFNLPAHFQFDVAAG